MQIIKSQGNIVEKIIRDKEGKLIRARFFVYENAGRIKARLLDFVYLTEQTLLNSANLLLSVISKTISDVLLLSNFLLTPKHYELSSVYTIGSKPRAPTLI